MPIQLGEVGAGLGEQCLDHVRLPAVEPAAAQERLKTLDILAGDVAVMVNHGVT